MKILVFTNMFPFERMPFYGSFVADEAAALRREGCDVDVLFINGIASKLNYFGSPFRFGARLRRESYDIVHCHHSFCGAIAVLQKRVPVVWTFHEGEIAGDAEAARKDPPLKRLAHSKRFKRSVARRVDALITVAEQFKEVLGRSDAYTLPSGIDIDLFRPIERVEARRQLGFESDAYYVLFPSTPARPEKRFELARSAVERAVKRIGGIEIVCLDAVPHERVPLYMNACNLLLMTSAFEASPVTVREALACDVPVVSTDVGDVRVMLEKIAGCAIVSPDPDTIAGAVVDCLLRHPRVHGREAVERFSLAGTAGKLMEIYRTLLDGGK
jgi:teichuronic acid biosynthesis glycosyltransferase TuaC